LRGDGQRPDGRRPRAAGRRARAGRRDPGRAPVKRIFSDENPSAEKIYMARPRRKKRNFSAPNGAAVDKKKVRRYIVDRSATPPDVVFMERRRQTKTGRSGPPAGGSGTDQRNGPSSASPEGSRTLDEGFDPSHA